MSSPSLDELLDKANELYSIRKLGDQHYYTAPEIRPQIKSDQVLVIFEVLYEELVKCQKI